ncbi:hypothetical protein CA223_21165 [Sphingomonas koreensis]|uniref:Uncharacterized protein n=2 Tax=Sphingomonadaceae TaxID=41297 RepID=A0A1L3ZWW8_9SPHN|nr:hypothetical protein BSL82_13035 [Tardibacter chloracetimidivorans]RSU17400.1 hypothetical protein CA224_21180 [Sphingomonas koreensis]RSV43712.1 hypothetical protein CA233_15970 [Sphingomonas sp. ABOLD]RSU19587.1 hypothetical protein CA222_22010 [Sphingomonas koreensis]RSU20282.1 hypothetical protein CA225_22575 [Sphingomonas koreensis]
MTAPEIAPSIELSRAFWTHADALHSRRAYAALRFLGDADLPQSLERADQPGAGVARVGFDPRAQVLAPVAPGVSGELGLPSGEAFEGIVERRDPWPAGDGEGAAPRKNIDFVDLVALELERGGVAGPGGAQLPRASTRSGGSPRIEPPDGGARLLERRGETVAPRQRCQRGRAASHPQAYPEIAL